MGYDFSLDVESRNSLSVLLKRVKSGSVVLEFGPAHGRMTKYLKEELSCTVYGVEIDSEAAKDAKKYAEKIVVDDIESFNWVKEFESVFFDYIVFADVLEHLSKPENVLLHIKEFLKEDGSILVSVPNIAHNSIIINLLKDGFDYSDNGILDKTHVKFFTKKTFDALIKRCGYFIAYESAIYQEPHKTEFENSYEDVPKSVGEFLKSLPWGEMYQLVYELKLEKNSKVSEFPKETNRYSEDFVQFYLDYGNGFTEENSIKKIINVLPEIFSVEINLDLSFYDNISQIRIDPLNGQCIIEINTITLNDTNVSEQIISNSYINQQKTYYFGDDPQIILPNSCIKKFKSLEKLAVTFTYRKIRTASLKESLSIASEIISKKDAIIVSKNQIIENQNKTISDLGLLVHQLELLAQSLRIKNRIKKVVKKIVPTKIWNLLKLLKSKENYQKAIKLAKSSGIKYFLLRLKERLFYSISNKYGDNQYQITKQIQKEILDFTRKPCISIIMPVYNVDPKWLELAIESVKKQWYDNWELCICDDGSTNEKTVEYLKTIKHEKIKILFCDKNRNISGASNEALKMAIGQYIALMDNDDELTPNALYEVVKVINSHDPDFIYSDEDKIDMEGNYCDPHFKPDYSYDMLLSQNYICHLSVIKKRFIEQVGGWEAGLEGAQDLDIFLKVIEQTNNIYHIPMILYHWRKIPGSTAAVFEEKSYAQEAGLRAIENHLKRKKIKAEVRNGKMPGTYRIKYEILDNPLVSIIIPFKDKPELLTMCIGSILSKSTYKNFEIIGISNNSNEKATFDEMERLEELDKRVKFYEYNVPFNYSKINNYAVNKYAKGKHILLLNNDIEVITPEWIEEMLMHSQRDDTGCVGAKLYYPNDTIQHAGVILGLGGIAGHSHKYFPKSAPGYFGRLHLIQNLSAVTAACLMVKRSIYDAVNGLNEKDLKIAFNDVDFCLRVQELGYKNLFTPYCEAYHHESISRGKENSPEKIKRFQKESRYMQNRHRMILHRGDPYYNRNLTLCREDFGLK